MNVKYVLSVDKMQALISSDECYNECMWKLSESAGEAVFLWAGGIESHSDGFGRNSKQKELP